MDAREGDLCVQQREKDGEKRTGNENPALLAAVGKSHDATNVYMRLLHFLYLILL